MLIGRHWEDYEANEQLIDPEIGLTDEERDQRSVCVTGVCRSFEFNFQVIDMLESSTSIVYLYIFPLAVVLY